MPNTDSLIDVADQLKILLEQYQTTLGIADVYYGDQVLVPRTPTVCVEPLEKVRELAGVSDRTENTIQVGIMIYHGQVTSSQITRRECDVFAEQVEKVLHLDRQLGGLLIYGFCNRLESGYAERNGALMFSSRLTYQGLTKTRL